MLYNILLQQFYTFEQLSGVITEFFALCDGKVATYLQAQRNMLTHSSQAFSMYHRRYDIIMNHLHDIGSLV